MKMVELTVNGLLHQVHVADDELLLDVLRDKVGTTSVREGCGVGACGACTVLVDGHSVSSCLSRAVRFEGCNIETADGLPEDDPIVSAFVDSDAMQCGYCIPGFVLMTHELLGENPSPDQEQVKAHFEGNLCRCGTYPQIFNAVSKAAGERCTL